MGRFCTGCKSRERPTAARRPPITAGSAASAGRLTISNPGRSPPGVRVRAVGLGTGTLATYARSDDRLTYYEINPVARELAEEYFTFLGDAEGRMLNGSGKLEIVMGDGRLSLERRPEEAEKFHVIVVDAFTGDSIPMHSLTREAADIYSRTLAADGVLAIHITNHYLDLAVNKVRGSLSGWGLRRCSFQSRRARKIKSIGGRTGCC